MISTVSDTSKPDYLTADQLCIGVFVMLDLPWFKHSFTRNSFKIRTEEQLSELRALRLERYHFDPLRSDPRSDSVVTAELESPKLPADVRKTDTTVAAAQADPLPMSALAEQRQRMFSIRLRRDQVEQVEKAFVKAAAVMKNLNRHIQTRPRETLAEMGILIGHMVDAFLNSPDATLLMMGENSGGEDVYFHSLNVTILAMMLARELGFTPEQAHDMGIGAMLHDIGLSDIPDRIAKKSASESTKAERNLRATHVELGVALGRRAGLPEPALAVLAQHHELADGSGYPKGLKEASMTAAARLVSLVNFYDNLCNPIDPSKAMTPHEALSCMFTQYRSKFEARALQLLIRSLGIHPPGSVVQLSNQALAVVTSVNPNKPLRPWVLVYDENTPKDEALTLNLELESHISVTKSIRPGSLPPKVALYLNLRKRITYFFDAGSRDEKTGAGG